MKSVFGVVRTRVLGNRSATSGPMSFRVALVALGTLCLCSASHVFAPKPTSAIIAGFAADGFTVTANVTYNGARGFVATSLNTTLLSTGAHKLAYYVEGSAYDIGYLSGFMAEEGAGAMTNTYVDHFLVSLISVELDQKCGSRAFVTIEMPFIRRTYCDFVYCVGCCVFAG